MGQNDKDKDKENEKEDVPVQDADEVLKRMLNTPPVKKKQGKKKEK